MKKFKVAQLGHTPKNKRVTCYQSSCASTPVDDSLQGKLMYSIVGKHGQALKANKLKHQQIHNSAARALFLRKQQYAAFQIIVAINYKHTTNREGTWLKNQTKRSPKCSTVATLRSQRDG